MSGRPGLGAACHRDDTGAVSAGAEHRAMARQALLERDAERCAIAEVLIGAERGSGAVVLVEAPAGLGKSALLDDTVASASGSGLLVLRAGGHQLERAFSWGVARTLFEGLLRDMPQGLDGVLDGPVAPARAVLLGGPGGVGGPANGEAAFGILHALYWLVVRLGERRPTVLVVDDAHWADAPSLRFLTHLQPRITDLPVGLVIGARPDGDVDGLLGVVAGHRATRVLRLQALSGVAVEKLVRDRWPTASPEVCRRCRELTGGNPLQLRELLRAADELGETIEVCDVGDAAAVAARRLERFVRNRLAALPPPAQAMAEAVAVFEDEVPVHLAAALAQVDPAASGVAVDELVRTATPDSAVQYLKRALREPPPAATRAVVLAELGHVEAVAGRSEAVQHLEAAIQLVDTGIPRAALLLAFARALHHDGRLSEACEAFRRGLDELHDAEEERSELQVALEGGYLNSALFTPARARDAHRRARRLLAQAAGLTAPGELALLSKALMMRLWAGEDREAVLATARRLVANGGLTTDDAADSQVPWQVIASLSWADDYPTAALALRGAFADARRRGSVLAVALAGVLSARQMLWTGPIDEAVHDARAAWQTLPPGSIYRSSAAYCLVSGLLVQGNDAEATTVSGSLAGFAEPPFFAAWRVMAEGRVAAHRGADTPALAAFLAVGELHGELLIVNPAVLPWRSEAALAAHRLGQRDRATDLVAEELRLAERFGAPRAIGVARRAAGLFARGDDAVELLRSAAGVLGGCGARVEQARALTDLGAAVRRGGHPAQARPVLRDAVALADEVRAAAVADAARAELRLAGGRAARRALTPVERLTPGERRVAELAAAGRSNRQIANALFVTVKAVEWHLGNAYRKLDVRGRSDLPHALGIPGGPP
jgi:DNA-binding CsgD family transcriptional regulator